MHNSRRHPARLLAILAFPLLALGACAQDEPVPPTVAQAAATPGR